MLGKHPAYGTELHVRRASCIPLLLSKSPAFSFSSHFVSFLSFECPPSLFLLTGTPNNPEWPRTCYVVESWNFLSSCLYLVSARIIGVQHHAWFMGGWGQNPGHASPGQALALAPAPALAQGNFVLFGGEQTPILLPQCPKCTACLPLTPHSESLAGKVFGELSVPHCPSLCPEALALTMVK